MKISVKVVVVLIIVIIKARCCRQGNRAPSRRDDSRMRSVLPCNPMI
jgi:hypothetical protein